MPTAPERLGWQAGWWRDARRCPSVNHGPRPRPRPREAGVTLAVVHSISLPPGHYGGDHIERLFANRLDCAAHPYFEQLRGLKVSSHFLIRRDGELLQFVSCDRRAWHAGASTWRGRSNCNDFSIGIELEGLEGSRFEAAQYRRLARLLRALARRYPVHDVVGHEQIAPGRKFDPGPGFDSRALIRLLLIGPVSGQTDVFVGRSVRMRDASPKPRAARMLRAMGRASAQRCWRAEPIAV